MASVATVLALAGCSSTPDDGTVQLSYLIDEGETVFAQASSLVEAFEAENPDIQIEIETRPGGGEGDNLMRTRLATGDITDIFNYNSGSLLQALNPAQNMLPLTDDPMLDSVNPAFTEVVSADGQIFGVPFGTALAGGMFYNKKVFAEHGLEVPTTWDEFIANNETLKAAGEVPVIQSLADSTSAQMWVLTDFFNVQAAVPDFAEKYTKNEAHFADTPAALASFEHQQEMFDKGYYNADYASAEYDDAVEMVATGEGAQYPSLTWIATVLSETYPDQMDDIGYFPMPGASADKNGATVWYPSGVFISKKTAHPEEAKKFLAFVASTEACNSFTSVGAINGPFLIEGCELGDDVPQLVTEAAAFVDAEGKNAPALEFVSPVKGPALPQITVELGIGATTAVDAARRYDEDVKKQAQQLGLEGW
ncbi:ABC transporter substrate-binding protein [Microbacterium immunditiarum]|uniref:Raffinose/stachyose/melibiose transport system substrate-binding protein n=1 Tax=Microbacterium immunditiarum TaxID=337480 RepID=A0A7Y9GKE4_9MICO|nr:raffinose/stachyose/melibiose transport system substrate-binding protein [Microbacterium immunditiarum]